MKIRNIIYFLTCIFLIGFIFVVIQLFIYEKDIKNDCKSIHKCGQNNQSYDTVLSYSDESNIPIRAINDCNSCYCKMSDILIPRLLIYKVWTDNQPLSFIKFPTIDNYVIPTKAVENADIILSVNQELSDITFEKYLFDVFQKPLYILKYVENPNNPEKQIIKADKFRKTDINNFIITEYKTYTNFKQVINELKSTDKKIFYKIDLNSYIYTTNEIFFNSNNITGFVIKIGFYDSYSLIQYEQLLKNIEKNFVLVHRTGNHFFKMQILRKKYTNSYVFNVYKQKICFQKIFTL